MSKFGGEKRYADILTVLLVIVIIGIVALLGYFGYTAIRERAIENEAADAVQEFYNTLNDTNTASDDENEGNTELATLDDFNTSVESTSNGTATSGRKKTYLDNYEVKGTIKISKTGIEYPILERATVGSLSKAVGILQIATCDDITTPVSELNIPGTNAFILGHNYRNGQFFSDNDQLDLGDTIDITDSAGQTVTYEIYKMYYTTPDDISFMERELDPSAREITLQTCNDDSSQRLIIWAKAN